MDPQEIQTVVAAWQAGAISRETMTDIFRRGEVLPEGRSVEEEMAAITSGHQPQNRPNIEPHPPFITA
ncbi:MAG: hypothetical protein JWM16_5366 [Verrucomicrobiales bacterium]|nr:hypothetical protein [Verrucomicrobiales bacterium]